MKGTMRELKMQERRNATGKFIVATSLMLCLILSTFGSLFVLWLIFHVS